MAAKAIVVTVLVMFALCTPWLADTSVALPLPGYFEGEHVGLLCLSVFFEDADAPLNMLFQFNFDEFTNGGIDLTKAEELFTFLTEAIAGFGPLAGAGVIQQTCAYTPSQIANQFGLDALGVAQQLTPTYQNYGFLLYFILDVFYSLVPNYLVSIGLPEGTLTLRADLFIVNGANEVEYTGSAEVLQELAP